MGWLDVINAMLDHFLDRNSECLTDALFKKDLDEYRRLIEHNPRLVNMPDSDGCLPLSWAVSIKNEEVAIMLVQHGADPNIAIDYSRIPRSIAVQATLFCWRNFIEILAEKAPASLRQKEQEISVLEVLDQPKKYADMLFPMLSIWNEHKRKFLQNAGELKRLVESLLSKGTCPKEEIIQEHSPEPNRQQYRGSLRQRHKERQETAPGERQPLLEELRPPTPPGGRE